jgi:hypothetical protein
MTLSIMTLSIMTLSLMTQHNDTQPNDTQHNDTQPNDTQHNDTQDNNTFHLRLVFLCWEPHFRIVILSVVMLSVVAPHFLCRTNWTVLKVKGTDPPKNTRCLYDETFYIRNEYCSLVSWLIIVSHFHSSLIFVWKATCLYNKSLCNNLHQYKKLFKNFIKMMYNYLII